MRKRFIKKFCPCHRFSETFNSIFYIVLISFWTWNISLSEAFSSKANIFLFKKLFFTDEQYTGWLQINIPSLKGYIFWTIKGSVRSEREVMKFHKCKGLFFLPRDGAMSGGLKVNRHVPLWVDSVRCRRDENSTTKGILCNRIC